MPRDRFARQSLGVLHPRIKKSRVLMVGAGGIGCELLKNLVLTGFGEVHIVDLDTIDLSNLNRQFLFRQEHIKRSKALVAKESAAKFNPHVRIEAHHANIKDPNFNIDFFSSFAIVFNALDNLDARRHVNRMCLAANVPLIESGTTGFNGQVQVIKRGLTECYDCNPKETLKTFPVCTIRSTPSQPIHCIVWAKSYLFAEIFGTSEDEAPDLDTTEDSENAQEIEKLRTEAQALKRIRESMGSEEFPRLVFDKVFTDDINRLRSMEDMWKSRKKPEPLDFDELETEALREGVRPTTTEQDQVTWTPAENFAVFKLSLKRLSDKLEETRANAETGNAAPVLSFDKDDKDSLDFVAASANLRSLIFRIDTKSKFEIKQMAGNIIPAIATTNAMTASLCVLASFHVLRETDPDHPFTPTSTTLSKSRTTFLVRSVDRALSSEGVRAPNPHCSVCGVAHVRVEIELDTATLRDLVEGTLKGELAYRDEMSVSIEGVGLVYDPDLEDNLDKLLTELGVGQDSFITVTDEEDDEPRLNLIMSVKAADASPVGMEPPSLRGGDAAAPIDAAAPTDADTEMEKHGRNPIRLLEKYEIKHKPAKPIEDAIAAPVQANGTTLVNGNTEQSNGHASKLNGTFPLAGEKRKRDVDDTGLEVDELSPKRGKVMEGNGQQDVEAANGVERKMRTLTAGADTVVLEEVGEVEEEEGAIVID